jgi:hypothetical protein
MARRPASRPGLPPRIGTALAAIVASGPIPAIHGVVRWRIIDLCQWLLDEHRVTVSKQTLSRELRALGYRKLSARPRHHAQRPGAIEDFKTYGLPPLQGTCSLACGVRAPFLKPGFQSAGSTVRPSRFHHSQMLCGRSDRNPSLTAFPKSPLCSTRRRRGRRVGTPSSRQRLNAMAHRSGQGMEPLAARAP